MKIVRTIGCIFLLKLVLLATVPTYAESWAINYQAYVTTSDGSPIDSLVAISFAAFNTDTGGSPLWSQMQNVEANQGLVQATLGNPLNPFPASLFDSSVYIEVTVNGEVMQPRQALLSSAFSFKAANSELLNGLPASSFDQSAAVQNLESGLTEQDARLVALEQSPADITSVVAGAGLTGGAQSGGATLSLAVGGVQAANMSFNAVTGGAIQAGAVNSIKIEDGTVAAIDLAPDSIDGSKIVDSSITSDDIALFSIDGNDLAPFTVTAFQLRNGAVTGEKIAQNVVSSSKITNNSVASIDVADGSLSPIDLDQSAVYSLGGLNVQGDTSMTGSVLLKTGATDDLVIADDLSQIQWRNESETQQRASLVVGNSSITLTDDTNSRDVLISKSTGIGIGTTQLSNTPITMAGTTINGGAQVFGNTGVSGDLTVGGTLNIGYAQISSNMQVSGSPYSCSVLFECVRYSATATCPAGYMPVGGGFNFTTPNPQALELTVTANAVSIFDPASWECSYHGRTSGSPLGVCKAICLQVSG